VVHPTSASFPKVDWQKRNWKLTTRAFQLKIRFSREYSLWFLISIAAIKIMNLAQITPSRVEWNGSQDLDSIQDSRPSDPGSATGQGGDSNNGSIDHSQLCSRVVFSSSSVNGDQFGRMATMPVAEPVHAY